MNAVHHQTSPHPGPGSNRHSVVQKINIEGQNFKLVLCCMQNKGKIFLKFLDPPPQLIFLYYETQFKGTTFFLNKTVLCIMQNEEKIFKKLLDPLPSKVDFLHQKTRITKAHFFSKMVLYIV